MSLIQFRGRPILPPVVNQHSQESEDENRIEDKLLLSMPSSEALKFILCGLSDHPQLRLKEDNSSIKSKRSEERLNLMKKDELNLKGTKYSESIGISEDEKKIYLSKTKAMRDKNDIFRVGFVRETSPITSNSKNSKDINAIKEDSFESRPCVEKFLTGEWNKGKLKQYNDGSLRFKEHNENEVQAQNSHSSEDDKSRSFGAPEQPDSVSSCDTASKSSVSGVTNHQKLNILKSSGSDSSSYLQDYLQLLTSRSHFPNVGKLKKDACSTNNSVLERRGSAPLLSSKRNSVNTRQRNSSGSSDKSSLRSLGSTYLDSYLGNLTDHSWIIYPTIETPNSTDKPDSLTLDTSTQEPVLSPSSRGNDYLQRRLHFINPEKFFNASNSDNVKGTLAEEPLQAASLKSCNSNDKDHDLGLTDTSGIVVSPDLSSSSRDTDKFDASHPLSSLQETPDQKDCTLTEEASSNETAVSSTDNHNTKLNNDDDNFEQMEKQVEASHDAVSNILNVTFDKYLPTEISCENSNISSNLSDLEKVTHDSDLPIQLHLKGLEEEDEDTSNNSEISSITSTDDAEEQVSMIVCETFRPLDAEGSVNKAEDSMEEDLPEESQSPLPNIPDSISISKLSKTHKSIAGDETALSQSSDSFDTVTDFSGGDNSISKLINMLKAKQEEEVREMRRRHEVEMNKFLFEISQMSASQRLTLVKVYDPTNTNEVLQNSANSSKSSGSSSTLNGTQMTDSHDETFSSTFNHSGSAPPSFFLHEEKQDTEADKRSDISKISQIFSPPNVTTHSIIRKSTSDILTFNPTLSQVTSVSETRSDSELGSSLPTKTTGTKAESRKCLRFSTKLFEAGLDLVPTRERDGASQAVESFNSKYIRGICKLQAIVRGKRVRKMMKIGEVQQLLGTLKEVAKLAHQFHEDILMDNIRKGDIDFHKALFGQEQQAREKLIEIMVNMNPKDQIRMIEKDRINEQRENQRRLIDQSRVPISTLSLKPKFIPNNTETNKNLSFKKSATGRKNEVIRQAPKKTFSELPRPCKANQVLKSRTSMCSLSSSSTRGRQSNIPSQRGTMSKTIPKQRIVKKIEPNPQPHLSFRRQNTPMCKSESGFLNSVAAKANKCERTGVVMRGDILSSRKSWR